VVALQTCICKRHHRRVDECGERAPIEPTRLSAVERGTIRWIDERKARRLDCRRRGEQIAEPLLGPRAARAILGREILRSRAHQPAVATRLQAAGGGFSWK